MMGTRDEEIRESGEEGCSFTTPQLPGEIYGNLPEVLRESTDLFQDATEKDVFLIGSLAVLRRLSAEYQGDLF